MTVGCGWPSMVVGLEAKGIGAGVAPSAAPGLEAKDIGAGVVVATGLEAKDIGGETALGKAKWNKKSDVVAYLRSKGATE